MNEPSLDIMLDKLEEACEMEFTEVGEHWSRLVNLRRSIYNVSPEFKAAWEDEIRTEYEHLQSNFEIVEHEVQTETYTERELRYIG